MNVKVYFYVIKMYIIKIHAEFALKWQPLIKVNTLA